MIKYNYMVNYRVTEFSYIKRLPSVGEYSIKKIKFETVNESAIDKARLTGEYDNGEQCRIINEHSVVDIRDKQTTISVKYTKGCYVRTDNRVSSGVYIEEVSADNNDIKLIGPSNFFKNTRIGKLSTHNTVIHTAIEPFVCFNHCRIRECNLSGLKIKHFKQDTNFDTCKLGPGYVDNLIMNDVELSNDAIVSLFKTVKARKLESNDERVIAEWSLNGRIGDTLGITWLELITFENACHSYHKIIVDRRVMEAVEKNGYVVCRHRHDAFDIVTVAKSGTDLVNIISLHGRLRPIDCKYQIEQLVEKGILKEENVELID